MSTSVTQSWLKTHERIIIVFMILVCGTYGFNHWLDRTSTKDSAKAVASEQIATSQAAANKLLTTQLAQQTALFEQEKNAHAQEVARIVAAMASRNVVTKQAVAVAVAPKTPSQAVSDLSTAYTLPVAVVPTDTGADVPTADLQQFTAIKIEHDALQSDVLDLQTQVTSDNQQISADSSLVTGLQTQVTGLNAQVKDNDVACKAEVTASKAQARRSKGHWFLLGVVTGFIGRSFLK
jgi:hypothetical protein